MQSAAAGSTIAVSPLALRRRACEPAQLGVPPGSGAQKKAWPRAAAISVDGELAPHSIRAYFIRRGDHHEPVRYEVDRIRDGLNDILDRIEGSGYEPPPVAP